MPFLHVHKRRVPTQNVYRSVTAIQTSKSSLAFARFYIHGSASFIWHTAAAGLNVKSPREAAKSRFRIPPRPEGPYSIHTSLLMVFITIKQWFIFE